MKFRAFFKLTGLKPILLLSCLLVSILSVLPVTVQAASVYFSSGQYYDRSQDYDRYRGRQSYNYRRQDRALDFYYGGNRNRGRYIDYNRGYRSRDEYCPDGSYSGYRDRRSYQRPRGFGLFYYGKQR